MKKILLLTLIVVITIILDCNKVSANADYKSYQEIYFVGEGIFLKDFTEETYERYKPEYNLKWRIIYPSASIVTNEKRVKYIESTIFSFYNTGTSAIKYNATYKQKSTTKYSLSSTGSIGIDTSKTGEKKFKKAFDSAIKVQIDKSVTSEYELNIDLSVDIDPNTMVNIYIQGEGKITNGICNLYSRTYTVESGGYEVFLLTSQTYRIEKVKI